MILFICSWRTQFNWLFLASKKIVFLWLQWPTITLSYIVKCKFSLPNFWSQVWWANQEISILQVPNWDMLCLFALDFTYKSKIRWLVFNSRRIAMGKYKSKKFWNGVIWCLWACTFCDDNFAELSSVFGILYFGVFWILLGYFICFWLKHHRKLQKTGG